MLAELQFLNSNPIAFPVTPFVGLRAWDLGIMGCELCAISFEIQGVGASGLRFRNLGHRVEGIGWNASRAGFRAWVSGVKERLDAKCFHRSKPSEDLQTTCFHCCAHLTTTSLQRHGFTGVFPVSLRHSAPDHRVGTSWKSLHLFGLVSCHHLLARWDKTTWSSLKRRQTLNPDLQTCLQIFGGPHPYIPIPGAQKKRKLAPTIPEKQPNLHAIILPTLGFPFYSPLEWRNASEMHTQLVLEGPDCHLAMKIR